MSMTPRHIARTLAAAAVVLLLDPLDHPALAQPADLCEGFRPLYAGAAGALFGLGGLLVGAAMGRSIVREEWVPVPLPERVGLAPTPGGGLAVRLGLRL